MISWPTGVYNEIEKLWSKEKRTASIALVSGIDIGPGGNPRFLYVL